jgi:hypothetical protein
VLVAVLGDFLEAPLGLLEALGLPLARLLERLAGGIVTERLDLAADLCGLVAGRLLLAPLPPVLRRVHRRQLRRSTRMASTATGVPIRERKRKNLAKPPR